MILIYAWHEAAKVWFHNRADDSPHGYSSTTEMVAIWFCTTGHTYFEPNHPAPFGKGVYVSRL